MKYGHRRGDQPAPEPHGTRRGTVPAIRPDGVDVYGWLYERAEEAAFAGLSLEEALRAVRDGYSSIEADREIARDQTDAAMDA